MVWRCVAWRSVVWRGVVWRFHLVSELFKRRGSTFQRHQNLLLYHLQHLHGGRKENEKEEEKKEEEEEKKEKEGKSEEEEGEKEEEDEDEGPCGSQQGSPSSPSRSC